MRDTYLKRVNASIDAPRAQSALLDGTQLMALSVPADHAEIMRGIRTFAQVVQYLVDDQDWPDDLSDRLAEDSLTAVTYDWDPDEMGIPAEQAQGFEAAAADATPDREPALGRVLP